MIFTRVFILENAAHILIRDETGTEVKFQSFAEFFRCSGIDLTGKYNIGYEPAINYFADSEDGTINADDIPYAPYEYLIDNLVTLQANKDDVTYGRTDPEIVEILKPERTNESQGEFRRRQDVTRGGDQESKQFRKDERTAARNLRKEAKGIATTPEIEWLDIYDAMLDEEDRLQDKQELLDEYIDDAARTAQELLDLDVTDDSHWI